MLTDDAILNQVRDAFHIEQAEHCQAASELLLELERGVTPARCHILLNELFRQAHSMKGGARAANLPQIEQIAHAIEDLFSAARTDTLQLTPDVCDQIYAALDAIGTLTKRSAAQQPIELTPYQPLLDQLAAAYANRHAEAVLATTEQESELPAYHHDHTDTTVRLSTTMLDGLLSETGELLTCAVRARTRAHEAKILMDLPTRWRRLWRQAAPILGRSRQMQPVSSPTVHYLDLARHSNQATIAQAYPLVDNDLAQLAAIMKQAHTLISEVEHQLGVHARHLAEDHDQLADVTSRLHDQIWRTRLLPVATLQPALRLQLRDMARSLDKQVNLVFDDGGSSGTRSAA